MRDDWVIKQLDEVCTKFGAGPFGSNMKVSTFVDEGIPVVSGNHMTELELVEETFKYITEDHANRMQSSIVQRNDVVITKAGTIGQVSLIPENSRFLKYVLSSRQLFARPNVKYVVPKYLAIYLKYGRGQDQILSNVNRTGVPSLSQAVSFIKNVRIELPPLPEQKRIVDLISSVDLYIEALQQQLESAKGSRNAVLHEFMNGEGTAFEQTQLGQIAKFLNGKAYSKEELLTVGKYRVLRVGNFFSNNNWYWSDLELEPNKYCENGDLLYAWSASFGPRLWNEEKVIYHYHIWKVNPDESQVDKKWLFYWLEDDVERIKSASGSGSIMMHVTKSEIEKRAIKLPTLSEQNRQLIILESFDQNIHTLESLIGSTNQLRSSMLSDLLSGDHEIPASYDKVIGAA
jgi:type I restriction enzyme, S subunit